ncbi:MAG: acyl-CoA thioesterase [Thalassobium sp.]|jgi:acyl-CoA thioesterase YciA|uniref:Acyl-CoA thioesterase n=1 Tax=Thalassolituus pacificus TaxID=2975440 RepID=A0A9X2WF50_9GAMM|nr:MULTISPECIES: acyl-CoA thioesterase [Thalassolituus]MCB2387787.1 acyl-CoA thioesterase [Thalassolituus alkanivorans]MCB2422513.1 acyl-CoA thioesterase [Thalassolituus alkanivorans]MCT7359114.1 acyl-CoA thioesterase [Thalassolituus pacificus]PHS65303.1 MAG: acyl-CoA thioesterase [Thalassobium sp.]
MDPIKDAVDHSHEHSPEDVREDCEPTPEGELALRLIPTRSETNVHGDISGGWVVAQMDHAAESVASRLAQGRIANVALESVVFMSPIRIGAAVCFYTRLLDIGTSSIRIAIEVWTQNPNEVERRKVVDAVFVYVAIDETGRIRRVPR